MQKYICYNYKEDTHICLVSVLQQVYTTWAILIYIQIGFNFHRTVLAAPITAEISDHPSSLVKRFTF
jgi:hypothetical protein